MSWVWNAWNLNVKTLWVKITTLSFFPLLTYLLRVGRIGFRGGRASPPLGLEVTKGGHALMLCMTVCLYAGTVLGVFPLHRFFLVPPLSPSAHPFGLGRLSRSGASLRNGAVFPTRYFSWSMQTWTLHDTMLTWPHTFHVSFAWFDLLQRNEDYVKLSILIMV